MRRKGDTRAPFGHVLSVAVPRAAAPSVSPSCRSAPNPLLPQVALKSPAISMLPSALARTDWPTAASAADHSRQYAGNGARDDDDGRRGMPPPPRDERPSRRHPGRQVDDLCQSVEHDERLDRIPSHESQEGEQPEHGNDQPADGERPTLTTTGPRRRLRGVTISPASVALGASGIAVNVRWRQP